MNFKGGFVKNPLTMYVDYFSPQVNGLDKVHQMRIRALLYFSLLGLVVGFYSMFKWLSHHSPILVTTSTILIIFFLSGIVLLKKGFPYLLAANIALVGITIHSHNIVYQLGGIKSPHIFWLVATIVFAYLLANNKTGLVWFIIEFFVIVFLVYQEIQGVNMHHVELEGKAAIMEMSSGFILPFVIIWMAQAYIYKMREVARSEAENLNKSLVCQSSQLQDMINEIKATSDTLAVSSHELTTTLAEMQQQSTVILQGTNEQADVTFQMSENLSGLTDSVQSNTVLVEHIAQNSISAEVDAKESNSAMVQAIDAMERIKKNNVNIDNATTLITSIADQTNRLALNAAIEAARAGIHGKGFAVVADAVRTLSQRCNEAAMQIRELLEISKNDMDQGHKDVHTANSSLVTVVEAVDSINKEMNQVQTSTRDQQNGISEVAEFSGKVARIAQSSAESAKDLSNKNESLIHVTESLVQQAERLKRILAKI